MFRFYTLYPIPYTLFIIGFLLLAAFPVSAGLVPCGGAGQSACTLCDLFVLADNIIDFLVTVSFALAGLMIAFGGILFVAGAGNPGQIQRAKGTITAALIGIIIVLVAWVVIDTILVVLAGSAQPPGFLWPWNEINCIP